MALTLELSPAEEAALAAQARAQNQAIADRAHALLRSSLGTSPETAAANREITEAQQALLTERLLATGLMPSVPAKPGQTVPFQPITVTGPPVSQTLLEDREQ